MKKDPQKITLRSDVRDEALPLIREFIKAKYRWTKTDTQVINVALLDFAKLIRKELATININQE